MQPRNPVNQNSSFEIPRLPFPVFPSRMSVFCSSSNQHFDRLGDPREGFHSLAAHCDFLRWSAALHSCSSCRRCRINIGYTWLVVLAFTCHVLSTFVTFADSITVNAYNFLYSGMFPFAYANGTLEAVANPVVAMLFPQNPTQYLNVLHASSTASMIIGAAIGRVLDDIFELG